MPIQENALNAALAEVLTTGDLTAAPEETHASTGAKRCDVQVRGRASPDYYTAIECKVGHTETQRRAAVKDAQRWLVQADCWGAVAVCYPPEMADSTPQSLVQRLQAINDLHMVQVDQTGPTSPWIVGGPDDLARLASDASASDTDAITKILGEAIVTASESIDEATGKELAGILQLPYEPRPNQTIDPRPARIACLLMANMALLQHRLRRERLVPGLESLLDIQQAAVSRQLALLENWKRIRKVDYAPVVDPALSVLRQLRAEHGTEQSVLRPLLTAVLQCAGQMRGLQLDHAGPLYHQLLETARYDGSFYTSTAAAVLLAELAMPPHWQDDWSDANRLTQLKVCDPACGTGTLLMAAARTIEARYLGEREDLEALHLGLVEDVLHGLDINRHAIHLAACMLTLSAPRIDYNRMNLFNMQHGVDANGDVRAGSLDILVNEASVLTIKQQRATSTGYTTETPDLTGRCDLVIMNPPFTRNDIRNRSLAPEHRRLVQRHEVDLAKRVNDPAHGAAIDQTSVRTFFTPIADLLIGNTGTLALVAPFTACVGAAGKAERDLLTDPARFELELVVTSHDNRRIFFSENTDIHESLIVARRPNVAEARPTTFVSLAENPPTANGARLLAEAIQSALAGDLTGLSDYGNLATRTLDELRGKPWNATCFYDQSLAEA
ncbi:MAG: SAM-dependent DNA methyltransferase [Gammaproteobacteria bacterium]|nr:SAM-dependent DNA methyltransferase [Gammaproteobacteria bacterium]